MPKKLAGKAPIKRHRTHGALLVPVLGLFAMTGLAWTASAEEQALSTNPSHRTPVRGVVRASSQAVISTDLSARVARVGFKEGAQFQKGDVLVAFDCRRHEAELASAEAQHREMLVVFESAT